MMNVPNPALPMLKQRAIRALSRIQIIYQGGQPAFFVLSEGDWNDLKQHLLAPEVISE